MSNAFTFGPIVTMYEGIAYRSRLEARWARFFHLLDVPALYEHEGFELPSGKYLPDFFLPHLQAYVEIKGQRPTDEECDFCAELCELEGMRVFCFWGPVGVWFDRMLSRAYQDSSLAWLPLADIDGLVSSMEDNQFWPCVCPVCDRFGIEHQGQGDRICASCSAPEKSHTFEDERLVKASRMANAESFWR